jgi:AraC-like DNA-binding protein
MDNYNEMRYREFFPGDILKHYVQCYFICESDAAFIVEDKVYATGFVEIMFNLGANSPQKIENGDLVYQPDVQLWGQTIRPFTFTSIGKHTMFGVRFFAHTAACFFDEPIETFNDQVIDFNDIAGKDGRLFYIKLVEAGTLDKRIKLVEKFLLKRLSYFGSKLAKLKLMTSITQELGQDDFFENINSVAARYGLSSRYLQKIFLTYSGLTPSLFSKINRFQKSLKMVVKKGLSLTAIACECGYYDQSHFIKDFKYFTGFVPSHFHPESSTDFFASLAG